MIMLDMAEVLQDPQTAMVQSSNCIHLILSYSCHVRVATRPPSNPYYPSSGVRSSSTMDTLLKPLSIQFARQYPDLLAKLNHSYFQIVAYHEFVALFLPNFTLCLGRFPCKVFLTVRCLILQGHSPHSQLGLRLN